MINNTVILLIIVIHISIAISKDVPACMIKSRHQQQYSNKEDNDNRRIIVIGDIHGSYDGLLDNLFSANVTSSKDSCHWDASATNTIVVQMGDIVDRGPQALEALQCLRTLQAEAVKHNSKVIRLFGNHEMWWLTGIYYKRHPKADTKKRIINVIQMITEDVIKGDVVGAYSHTIHDVPILFTHAGISKNFYNYLKKEIKHNKNEKITTNQIVSYTNKKLIEVITSCSNYPCQMNQDKYELFDAGPDRGGSGIGGPFWTDFSTIVANGDTLDFIQVVGHTMAYCYDPRKPDVHPSRRQAECNHGLTRATADLRSICVDGGMYLGARTFLEIAPDGHFRSYQRYWNYNDPSWYRRDLTNEVC